MKAYFRALFDGGTHRPVLKQVANLRAKEGREGLTQGLGNHPSSVIRRPRKPLAKGRALNVRRGKSVEREKRDGGWSAGGLRMVEARQKNGARRGLRVQVGLQQYTNKTEDALNTHTHTYTSCYSTDTGCIRGTHIHLSQSDLLTHKHIHNPAYSHFK